MSPLGRNFYLNITPNNLVHLYLHTDAVPEGSPTTVKIRELSSKDWETSMAEATESLCSSSHLSPVTNCVSGQISADTANLTTHNKSLFTNPTQKQSLSELVSCLRNCNSARTQAPNPVGLSVASTADSASTRSTVAYSSHGVVSEHDSLHRTQTSALNLNNQWKISDSRSVTRCEASYVPESRCLQTPSQVTGARFRFKRTPTTPIPSAGQSSLDVQHTSPSHQQCSAAAVTTTPRSQQHSLIPASVRPTATAIGQVANIAVDDMWDSAGKCLTTCYVPHVTDTVCW